MYIDVFWSWWLYPTSRSWCPIFKIKCSAAHLLNADYIIMYIKNQTIKLHCTVWCKTYNVMDSFWKHWVCYLTNTKNNTHRMIWIYVHTFEILLDAMVKWPLFEYFWLLSGKKAQGTITIRCERDRETTRDDSRRDSMLLDAQAHKHKNPNPCSNVLLLGPSASWCLLAKLLAFCLLPSNFQDWCCRWSLVLVADRRAESRGW